MAPRTTSLIWNHFLKLDDNVAKCKECSKKILTKNHNTKGLWKHLQSIHPIDHFNLEKNAAELRIKKSNEIETIRKETFRNNNVSKQPTLKAVIEANSKYDSSHPKQQKFDDAIVEYLTDGNFPAFSSVETQGFKKLFDVADSKLTVKSRHTYARKVDEKHKSVLKDVLEIVDSCNPEMESLSFTNDCWTSRKNDPYISR